MILVVLRMWYLKSVVPSTGGGSSEIQNRTKMLIIVFVRFYLDNRSGLESAIRPIKCFHISSLLREKTCANNMFKHLLNRAGMYHLFEVIKLQFLSSGITSS